MRERLKGLVKRLFKIPPEPEAPAGAPGSVRVFRAAPGYFRYRLLGWGLKQASFLIGVTAVLVFRSFVDNSVVGFFLALGEGFAIVVFVVQLPFSFLMLSLDYEYRWYMISDRSLRIREGLFKIQERTMTFSNIQNVSIRQGPLQRVFGISNLEVRTAGGGGTSAGAEQHQSPADNLHVGILRGVDNAAEIRDTILDHLRRIRSAGLGDPDEPETAPAAVDAAAGSEIIAAGQQTLAEARALRRLFA